MGRTSDFEKEANAKKRILTFGQLGPPKLVAETLKMAVGQYGEEPEFLPLQTGYIFLVGVK